jgi:hypothetical protein
MAPNPAGMSGSPIWVLYDHDGENDPTTNLVAGILIEHWRENQLFVGTDVGIARQMIQKLSLCHPPV